MFDVRVSIKRNSSWKASKIAHKYKEYELDQDYRIDILVENEYILELKAVELVLPIYQAQIITYLKLANKRIGFLINFNEIKLINGFRRIIQG